MKRKPIKPLLRAIHSTIHSMHLRAYETYQPVLGNKAASTGARDCEQRWQTILEQLRRHHCASLLDLGCSEGYYVIQAAKSGLQFCVGVDFDLRRIWTCQNQVVLNDLHQAAFMISEATPELIDSLPRFDAVIFLSVLHHIMYEKSEAYAAELLRALAKKVDRVMFFEMGQSDEHLESWAKKIPDMGADPHAWIADYLRAAGFSEVEKIGEAQSFLRESSRALFAVRP